MRWKSGLGRALVLVGLTASGITHAECVMTKLAELPVTMVGHRPIIPAKVNGTDISLLVDSGAYYSNLSRSAANRLNLVQHSLPLNYNPRGVFGESLATRTTVDSFELASTQLKHVEFLVSPVGGDAADGLLGQNILGMGEVEYDLPHGAVRLIRTTGCGGASLAYWTGGKGASFISIQPMDDDNRATIGRVLINGHEVKVLFDTGARSSLTYPGAVASGVKLAGEDVEAPQTVSGIGNATGKAWIAPIASFKIGDEEIRNTRLAVLDVQLDVGMLLGVDFFLSHRVLVSNTQHRLYFTYEGGPVFNVTATALTRDNDTGVEHAAAPVSPELAEPTDADGYARRAAASLARRDAQHAISDLDKAVALAPKVATYRVQRGEAYRSIGQKAPALQDLNLAVTLDPDSVNARVARARLQLQSHDYPSAIADLDHASVSQPATADHRLTLANLYSAADNFSAAIVQYTLWLSSHPGDPDTYRALNGRCWGRAITGADLDKALNDCDRALSLAPNDPQIRDSRGMVNLRRGAFQAAVSDYDKALAANPKLAWSLYGRSLAKQRLGLLSESQADLTAALALEPDLPARARTYGIVT